MTDKGPKLVVIGGGTGSFTLLSKLKHHTPNLSAIVNMSDDGGSTGVLRDELGVLPPGDVRQCLVALAEESDVLRKLFNYRFEAGSLQGHSFGNLFLSALEKVSGDFGSAVEESARILNITGQVIPVTLEDIQLVLQQPDGEMVGELSISKADLHGQLPHLQLKPNAALNPKAAQAITEADLVIIAPGHLYGSLIPALLVDGLAEAIQKSPAKTAYVCNLVTKPGQTDGFQVSDYADEIERFIGKGSLDYVLYNNQEPTAIQREHYAKDKEYWVKFDEAQLQDQSYQAIGGPLMSQAIAEQSKADNLLMRSSIRHDADAVATTLLSLLK